MNVQNAFIVESYEREMLRKLPLLLTEEKAETFIVMLCSLECNLLKNNNDDWHSEFMTIKHVHPFFSFSSVFYVMLNLMGC